MRPRISLGMAGCPARHSDIAVMCFVLASDRIAFVWWRTWPARQLSFAIRNKPPSTFEPKHRNLQPIRSACPLDRVRQSVASLDFAKVRGLIDPALRGFFPAVNLKRDTSQRCAASCGLPGELLFGYKVCMSALPCPVRNTHIGTAMFGRHGRWST